MSGLIRSGLRPVPCSHVAHIMHSLEKSQFKCRLLPGKDNEPNQLFLTRLGTAGHASFVAEIRHEF